MKKFFNTSGVLYKEMELKNKLPSMSEDEQLNINYITSDAFPLIIRLNDYIHYHVIHSIANSRHQWNACETPDYGK